MRLETRSPVDSEIMSSRHPRTTASSSDAAPTRAVWPVLTADVLAVVVFAGLGRLSHGEDLLGTPVTAWPFLVGLAVTWLVCRAWRAPGGLWPTGIVVWLGTVLLGMVLRRLVGEGTHWSFVVVTLIVTGIFLLGHRALGRLLARRCP